MPFSRTLIRTLFRSAMPVVGFLVMLGALLPIQGRGASTISVWVNPASATLLVGATQQFTTTVSGTTKTAVTWSCTGGTVTSAGLYTAPATPGTYTVKATLVSNASYFGTSTVTVVKNQVDGVSVSASPTIVGISQSVTVSASVTGSGDLSGTWSFSDGTASFAGGSSSQVYAYGTYAVSSISHTMPATPGTYTITFTSARNPAQSASTTITVVTPGVAISPASASVAPGGTQQFSATTVGLSNTAVTWSCSGGSISTTGLFTAPSTAGTYTVTATSVQDPTRTATATVMVAILVTLDPIQGTIYASGGYSFNATVLGTANSAVTWSCTGGVFSTPSPSGSSTRVWWTAPATAGHYTLTATSVADPTKSATLDVPVSIQVNVVSPTSILQVGGTYQAQAQVTGTTDTRVTWSIDPTNSASGGALSASGLFTAPASTPVGQRLYFNLKATSVVDPTQSGETGLTVYQPASVTVAPPSSTVPLGASVSLTATPLGSDVMSDQLEWEAGQGNISFQPASWSAFQGPPHATYQPPRALGTYVVRVAPLKANYASNPTPVLGVSATATLTVVQAPAVVTLNPGQVSIETGGTQQYLASVTGTLDPTILWSCSAGTISSTGLYTAPGTTGTYTITATSKGDPTGVASTTIIVRTATAKPQVTVSPKTATVAPGGSQSLNATVSNVSSGSTTWYSFLYSDQGSLSTSGSNATYTAPGVLPNSAECHPTVDAYASRGANSQVRPDLFDRAVVTLQAAGSINVAMDPSNHYEFIQGDTFQFKANVTGATDTRVKWQNLDYSLLTPTGSMDTRSGWTYTNPYQDFLVQAISVADYTRYAVASVRVWNKGAVRIFGPSSPSILPGQQVQLDVEVKGGGGVLWTATAGTMSPTGLYTPPSSVTADTPVTIQATNAINPNYTDSISLNVRATGSVDISPASASLQTGGKQTFTAKVWNSTASVNWSVRMADGSSLNPGTISNGLYTAPSSLNAGETSRSVIVQATNASDSTKWAAANVLVSPPASATPPPAAGTLDLGGVTSLWTGTIRTAYYNGSGDAVTWSITGGTILGTGRQQFGFPPLWYAIYQAGSAGSTATLTAKASNAGGSVSVTSSPISVTAVPDFAGVFTTSSGSTYAILDFGTVTEMQPSGSNRTYHKVWVNGTNGSLQGNDISIANSVVGTFSSNASVFNLPGSGAPIPANRTAGIIIGVDPATGAYAKVGSTLQFFAGMGGTANKAVTWTCSGGSISASGLYTPPSTPGTYTVTATSQADSTKSYTVKVGVDTGATLSGITGVFTGTTTYSGTDPRTFPVSVFTDGGNTYIKLYGVNTYSGANTAIASGTLTGRTFQGNFLEYNPGWYDSIGESVKFVFERQPDGSMAVSGGYFTIHGFPSTSGGVSYSSAPVWAAFSGAASPAQIDVAVVPHLQDGYYGTSMNYGWPEPHVLSGTPMSFKGLVCGTTNTLVNWTAISGSTGAVPATAFSSTTSANTTFTVPSESATGVNYTVTATSTADATKSDAALFPVDTTSGQITNPYPTVYLTAGLEAAASSRFFPGSTDLGVSFVQVPTNDATWTILNAGDSGTLTLDTPLGLHDHATYTPGMTPGVYTIQATSQWDATRSATTKIAVVEADPQVLYPTVNKTFIASGDSVTLNWLGVWAFNTPNPVTTLTILDQVSNTSTTVDVSNQTSYTCNPTHSTTFTFTVTSASGERGTNTLNTSVDVTQGASLFVTPNPVGFQSGMTASVFYSQGTARLAVQNVNYTWTDLGPAASGAGIAIDPSLVPWTTSTTVNVQAALTDAVGNTGTISTQIPIKPRILSFASSVPGLLTSNLQPVGLSWAINSANRPATLSLVATNSKGSFYVPLSSGGATSITVSPTETTTYTLTVTTTYNGTYGSVPMTDQASLTILVSDTVAALSITPASVTLPPGASQAFTASILAAPGKDGMTWSYSGGSMSGGGAGATWVAPQAEGTYTVTVASVVNSSLSATATVTVSKSAGTLPAPSFDILSFTSGSSPQGAGHLLLSWSAVGNVGIILEGTDGLQMDVTGLSSYDVMPNNSTIYTLTITDGNNYISRALTVAGSGDAVAVTPTQTVMLAGASSKFGCEIYAPSNRINWSCTGGTIGTDGTFTSPSVPGTYSVTATLVDDPTKSSSAIVTVNQIDLRIIPNSLTIVTGQSFGFGWQGLTFSDDQPIWSASAGSIQSNGVFTAPLVSGTITITLTSSKDSTKTATAIVNVQSIKLMVLPGTAWVLPQAQYQFAVVQSLGTVMWSVVEPAGGTVDANGLYTAPNQVGTYTLKATSVLDPTQSATAQIIVATSGGGNWSPNEGGGTAAPVNNGVAVDPPLSRVDAGTYTTLTATVLGNDDQTVTWSLAGSVSTNRANVDNQGVFTAREPGLYTVVATSNANPTLQGSAVMAVESSVHGLNSVPDALQVEGYTITVLKDGRVLIAGGQDTRVISTDPTLGYRGTAYLYDPVAKTFTQTGSLLQARAGHTATLLGDGRVLIAGGMGYFKWPTDPNATVQEQPVKWGEVYDPTTGQFQALPVPPNYPLYPAGSMRSGHGSTGQAVLLAANATAGRTGGQVFEVGGPYDSSPYNPFDFFDPTTNLFDLTEVRIPGTGDSLTSTQAFQSRIDGAVVALGDGRALLTGGIHQYQLSEPYPCGINWCALSEARIFDPIAQETLSSINAMSQARSGHTMTKLPDGRILIIGGSDHLTRDTKSMAYFPNPTATAEIFDPTTGTFTATGGMKWPRMYHAAILLPTGQVLVVGGITSVVSDGAGGDIRSYPTETEIYDPDAGTFSVMDKVAFGLDQPRLAVMKDGGIFVCGKPIVSSALGVPAFARKSPSDKFVVPMMQETLGSASSMLPVILAMFGQVQPTTINMRTTINQGVERYIWPTSITPVPVSGFDPKNALNNTETGDSPSSSMAWKNNVPFIQNRKGIFKTTLDFNKAISSEDQNKLNCVITCVSPTSGINLTTSVTWSSNGKSVEISVPLASSQTANTTFTLKLAFPGVFDGDRIYTYSPQWELSGMMNVHVIPVQYYLPDGTIMSLDKNPADLITYNNNLTAAIYDMYPLSDGRLSLGADAGFSLIWDERSTNYNVNRLNQIAKPICFYWDGKYNGFKKLLFEGLNKMSPLGISPLKANNYYLAVLPSYPNHSWLDKKALTVMGTTWPTVGVPNSTQIYQGHISIALYGTWNYTAFAAGSPWGDTPGDIAEDLNTSLHELGHQHQASHPASSSTLGVTEIDHNYPYKRGKIGTFGLRLSDSTIFPPDVLDLMGYGISGIVQRKWDSDYHFGLFFRNEWNPTLSLPDYATGAK